jgi:hypothetical protein
VFQVGKQRKWGRGSSSVVNNKATEFPGFTTVSACPAQWRAGHLTGSAATTTVMAFTGDQVSAISLLLSFNHSISCSLSVFVLRHEYSSAKSLNVSENFTWLRTWPSSWFFRTWQWPFVFHKRQGISWPDEELLAAPLEYFLMTLSKVFHLMMCTVKPHFRVCLGDKLFTS